METGERTTWYTSTELEKESGKTARQEEVSGNDWTSATRYTPQRTPALSARTEGIKKSTVWKQRIHENAGQNNTSYSAGWWTSRQVVARTRAILESECELAAEHEHQRGKKRRATVTKICAKRGENELRDRHTKDVESWRFGQAALIRHRKASQGYVNSLTHPFSAVCFCVCNPFFPNSPKNRHGHTSPETAVVLPRRSVAVPMMLCRGRRSFLLFFFENINHVKLADMTQDRRRYGVQE